MPAMFLQASIKKGGFMSHTDPEQACPHCGGTTGLYVTYHQVYSQQFAWDGYNLGPSDTTGPAPRIARCLECHKQVTKLAKIILPYNLYRDRLKQYDMGESIL